MPLASIPGRRRLIRVPLPPHLHLHLHLYLLVLLPVLLLLRQWRCSVARAFILVPMRRRPLSLRRQYYHCQKLLSPALLSLLRIRRGRDTGAASCRRRRVGIALSNRKKKGQSPSIETKEMRRTKRNDEKPKVYQYKFILSLSPPPLLLVCATSTSCLFYSCVRASCYLTHSSWVW